MAPKTMTATLTVRDIAKRIRQPGEALDPIVERLRNWTDVGILETGDEKNPGIGRRRHYTEAAVVDAFILSELTEWGIPAVHIANMHAKQADTGKALPVLRLARMAFEQVEARERAGEWCWLSVSRTRDKKLGPTAILHFTRDIYDPPQSRRIADRKRSFEDLGIPNWSPSSVVLNLTEMFKQLRKNPVEQ
jgi:hypothetical protein